MGMCKPSGGEIKRVGKVGSLKVMGMPNTREDLYDYNGNLLQQRWFGADGKAIHNRDWLHGGKHTFPHDHIWDYSKLNPRQPYEGEGIDEKYC